MNLERAPLVMKGHREIEISIVRGDRGFGMSQKGEGTSQLLRMVSRGTHLE